jgi:type II secretion system protein H
MNSAFHSNRAFTLMELLLVLALLAMAVAIAAPSLSRFFRGRALDSEARRMLSLTRYGQSRAVSEGVPMLMWFRPEQNAYGLQAETTYTDTDTKAVEYQLDSDLQMELAAAITNPSAPWKITAEIAGNQPVIRFTPDGFIADTSPAWVCLKVARENEPDAKWVALDDNRVKYELQNTQPR